MHSKNNSDVICDNHNEVAFKQKKPVLINSYAKYLDKKGILKSKNLKASLHISF